MTPNPRQTPPHAATPHPLTDRLRPHRHAPANPGNRPTPLDRILAGLNETTPTPGLEARLLQTLAQPQAPDLSLTARLRRRLAAVPHRGSLAALASLILLVALALPHRPRPAAPSPQAHPVARSPVILRNPQPVPDLASLPRPARTHPRVARPTPRLHTDDLPSDPTMLALAETNAPSHPAPPVLITPEERAFQRFISRHTAVSLAALSPENEPAHEAADQAQFERFFPPPPPPEPANSRPE